MEEAVSELGNHSGSLGAALPWWVLAGGMLVVFVVVSVLFVSAYLDWGKRRARRRKRVWTKYPVGQRTRPLAWIEPAGVPELTVLPKPQEGEKAA